MNNQNYQSPKTSLSQIKIEGFALCAASDKVMNLATKNHELPDFTVENGWEDDSNPFND